MYEVYEVIKVSLALLMMLFIPAVILVSPFIIFTYVKEKRQELKHVHMPGIKPFNKLK